MDREKIGMPPFLWPSEGKIMIQENWIMDIFPFQIYPCPREIALFCVLLLVESSNKMVISGDLQPNNLWFMEIGNYVFYWFTEEERPHYNKKCYTLLTVLSHLIDQRGHDRDTIVFVFYNVMKNGDTEVND